jgi:hypothetical protein
MLVTAIAGCDAGTGGTATAADGESLWRTSWAIPITHGWVAYAIENPVEIASILYRPDSTYAFRGANLTEKQY